MRIMIQVHEMKSLSDQVQIFKRLPIQLVKMRVKMIEDNSVKYLYER